MSYATLGILASRIPSSNEMNDEEMRPVDYGVNDGLCYILYINYISRNMYVRRSYTRQNLK